MTGNGERDKEMEAMEEEGFEQPPVAELHRKPKDPRSRCRWNPISRLLFIWLDPLMWLGWKTDLKQEDLYVHPQEVDAEKLSKQFSKYWTVEERRRRNGGRSFLWLVIFKCVWLRLIVMGIVTFINVALLVGQSIVLGYLASYFTIINPTYEDTRNAYLLAAGLVGMAFTITILHAHGFLIGQKIGMMCRIMFVNAIYQKILKLSQVTLGKVSTGHVINLASNDVQRFDLAFIFIHYLWITPLHIVVFTYLVYREIGWPAFIALGFILIQIPLQIFLARLFGKLRMKTARATDKRVKVMNEVITGIRVIKMYAWEYAFKHVVTHLRKLESAIIRRNSLIRGFISAYNYSMVQVLLFLIFLPVFIRDGGLPVTAFFTTLSLINILRRTAFIFFSMVIIQVSDLRVSLTRIQKLLELEELQTESVSSSSSTSSPVVRLDSVALSWSEDGDKKVISGLSFSVDEERPLLAVVGPVGAGKTTLLQTLLGELKPVEGTAEVIGRISYASQEPWVFSGTLRDNILLGQSFDSDRYWTVVEACALDKDVAQLLDGDLTLVGERGVTLSGGQKARVNLARAVYYKADLYLLDDPLSAVDTAVARQLFDRVVRGLLKGSKVVLVTHQLQFAQLADNILAIKDGHVEACGNVEELLAQGVELMEVIKTNDQNDEREVFSVHEDEGVMEEEEVREEEEEEDGEGEVKADDGNAETVVVQVSTSSTRPSPYMRRNILYTTESESNLAFSSVKPKSTGGGDDLKQFPPDTTSIYSAPSMLSLHSAVEAESSLHEDKVKVHGPPQEEKGQGRISLKTYYHYFRAGGGYLVLATVFFIFVFGELNVVFADWWLSDWAECSSRNSSDLEPFNRTERELCLLHVRERVGISGGAVLGVLLMNITRTIALYFVCVNASRVLHNRLFASILRAPILFFDTNPIGRILNRFSKDIGFLDELLPSQFVDLFLLLLRFTAVIITAIVSNYWVVFPAVVIMIAFILIRNYYLRTSRDIKRLEAIARSPLYSHISTTLQGLPTIRAFHQEKTAVQLLHRFQNEHSQGWYLYLAGNRWFGMRIDFISGAFLAAVAFISVPLAGELNAGLVGLGLTYSVSLAGMFQYCVRLSAEVENLMVSAERVLAYGKLDSEAPLETTPPNQSPPPDWPSKGALTFADVAFRYSPDTPLILKNISISINPSEKIGIVGRTGAGKSSLISVLFRLAEPFGQVKVDDVDSKEIGLHDLRSHISIIPQDPVLFSGTMRYNLDPFNDYTDLQLWDALDQVQLKTVVERLEGGLEANVTEGGTNFSVGQKQLVCLARALLRNNKILILDEATANVDIKTDGIIQTALREKFVNCTVLTIAHRLNTIMDSDRILVMNKGQVKEFDRPDKLLQQQHSLLRRMVEQTGEVAAHKLLEMAQEAAKNRNKHSGSVL